MKILKYILASCTLMLSVASCTYHFDEYNTNPNDMPEGSVSPMSLLEEILYKGADGMIYRTKLFNGELMQYTVSGTTVNSYHRYTIANGVMKSTWDHLYMYANNSDHMYNVAMAKEYVGDNAKMNDNAKAIALTMKALYVSNLSDMFGDIPFKEAFKAREKIDKPKIDAQKEVYDSILVELEKANDLYKMDASITIPSKDLMYNGDITKWRKFTNSLRLRLLMRLSNRDTEMDITAQVAEIINNPTKYPIFTSNADNAALFYTGKTPFVNRYGSETESSFESDRKAAENIISMMVPTGDPRLPLYFRKAKGNDWKGLPSGDVFGDGDNDGVSLMNKNSVGLYSSPYAFMKYDEVLFILAEAIKRNMVPGGDAAAKTAYEEAVTASVRWWESVTPKTIPLDAQEMTDFVQTSVEYNNTLEKILDQKYLALYWVGYEAWHEYRRTGFPNLRIGSATEANNFTLPTRFGYPISLQTTNPVNYEAQVSRMRTEYGSGDNMLTPVWWSKRAVNN